MENISEYLSESVLSSILYVCLTTVVFVVILLFLSWMYPKIYAAIENICHTRLKALKIQNLQILSPDQISRNLVLLAQFSRLLITGFVIYLYVPLVLNFFPQTKQYANQMVESALYPLADFVGAIVDYIPKLFFIAVIIVLTRYLIKGVRFFFTAIEQRRLKFQGFHPEWADSTYKLVRFLIFCFAFIVIFPYLPGSGSVAFQGVSVFLGILVSFGSGSAIANVVAGVVITYMRPFKLGDRVKIGETTGDVIEKNLLITRVRTIKNVDVTIPNAGVLASHILNYSSSVRDHVPSEITLPAQSQELILNTVVTVGYDIDWRKVHALLIDAALRTEGIMNEPKPFVFQTALNDFYVRYEINAYTKEPNFMAGIYSEMHAHIQDVFNEAQIELMSPHFAAIRDGNTVEMPVSYKEGMADNRKFRVDQSESSS